MSTPPLLALLMNLWVRETASLPTVLSGAPHGDNVYMYDDAQWLVS